MDGMAQTGETLKSILSSMLSYWQGLTQRERYLVLGLAMAALTMAPLSAWELAQKCQVELVQSRLELAQQSRMQGTVSRSEWQEIRIQAEQLSRWGWKAKSPAIGQVLVEQQINAMAMTAGMTSISISTNKELNRVGPLSFVRLQVNADFNWITFTQFLRELGKANKAFVVRSISVTGDMPVKVQLVLDAALNLDKSQ
jgi:hypothetical protein